MKKIFTLAIVVLMAISCSEITPEIGGNEAESIENELQTADSNLQPMTFAASADNGPDSKAFIDSFYFRWQEGDAISVFDMLDENHMAASNTKYELTAGAGTTSGTFHCDAAPTSESAYMAIYPYTPEATLAVFMVLGAGVPAAQTIPSENVYNDPSASLMIGLALADENTMHFKNVCSFIKLHIGSANVTEIDFIANNGEKLAGTFDLTVSDEEEEMVYLPVVNKIVGPYAVSLKPYGETFEADKDYYLAVLPQTLSEGFTVTVTTTDGNWLRTTGKEVKLTRSHILNIGSFADGQAGWSEYNAAEFFGKGTEDMPYMIKSYDNLLLLRSKLANEEDAQYYADAYYQQMDDIDCGGKVLYTIGTDSAVPFTGVYDGNGKSISNFRDIACEFSSGLFGYCKDAKFKDLTVNLGNLSYDNIHTVESSGTFKAPRYFGGIVGYALGGEKQTVFENCTVTGSVTVSTEEMYHLGGFAGYVGGDVIFTKCTNRANISGTHSTSESTQLHNAGGFVGYLGEFKDAVADFDRCRNFGDVYACSSDANTNAGGFIGGSGNIAFRIINCVNKGSVSAVSTLSLEYYGAAASAGGFVGYYYGQSDVDPYVYNSANTGIIAGMSDDAHCYVGGIMGYGTNGKTYFRVCANYGKVSAKSGDEGEALAAGICPADDGNLNIAYCAIKTGQQIANGSSLESYPGCLIQDGISCSDMDDLRTTYHFETPTYCEWQGANDDLDLVMGY